MTTRAWLAFPALLLPMIASAQGKTTAAMRITFDALTPGKPAAGFSTETTGTGAPGAWAVREDTSAGGKVLVQTSTDKTNGRFPLCLYDGLLTHNAVVSVRFKTLSGEVDQAAGLIARFRDKDNYYVVCQRAQRQCPPL